jgi:phospholipase/lecithinase/hemolysin
MSNIVSVVAQGDSLTFVGISYYYQAIGVASSYPYDEISFPRIDLRHFSGGNVFANWALGGYRITDLETQATALDALINTDYSPVGSRPGRRYVLVVRIGTNVQSSDAAVAAARVRTYCLARQAAGWHVVLCPITSGNLVSGGGASADTLYIQPYNAIIAGWDTTDGVAGVVSSTDAVMYGTGAYANTTYFSDGVHPTAAGHARLATDLNLILTPLLASLA